MNQNHVFFTSKKLDTDVKRTCDTHVIITVINDYLNHIFVKSRKYTIIAKEMYFCNRTDINETIERLL